MYRGMSRGGYGLRKSFGHLSANGWVCFLSLLFVWPEASQNWSLQAVGWGQVLVPKWQSPRKLTLMNISWDICHQCPFPHSEPQLTSASPGDPPREAGKSGLGSHRVTAFALGAGVHETLCVASEIGVSVSPSSVGLPAGLQSQMLWGLLLLLPDPQAGGPQN